MANMISATVTDTPLEVDQQQQLALDELLKKYYFEMEDVTLGQCDDTFQEFGIWGYDWLRIVAQKNGEPDPDSDDISEEFFEELRKILKPGQTFSVVCVSYTKLRSAGGMRITVTPEKVEWINI